MKEDKMTVGETTPMETTTSTTKVNELVVALLTSEGAAFKKVGGDFVSKSEVTKFIRTLDTISNVGPYDTTLTVDGVVYPLEAFKVDSRIAAAFMKPRAVKMPGASPFLKDVSVHSKSGEAMNPAEMIEFQHRFFAMFKVQANLVDVLDAIKPVLLGEVVDCFDGCKYHVEDLASVKSLPVELSIAHELFGDNYFMYDPEVVVKFVVINFYTSLK